VGSRGSTRRTRSPAPFELGAYGRATAVMRVQAQRGYGKGAGERAPGPSTEKDLSGPQMNHTIAAPTQTVTSVLCRGPMPDRGSRRSPKTGRAAPACAVGAGRRAVQSRRGRSASSAPLGRRSGRSSSSPRSSWPSKRQPRTSARRPSMCRAEDIPAIVQAWRCELRAPRGAGPINARVVLSALVALRALPRGRVRHARRRAGRGGGRG
jgi:hypothetical protein